MVEIDITASQPSFLCLLFVKGVQDDSIKEILEMYKNDKFVQIAKEYKMDIYKYMAVQIKGEEFRNDPVVRVNMKKVFFHWKLLKRSKNLKFFQQNYCIESAMFPCNSLENASALNQI